MLLLKLILERHVRAVELGERIHCIRMVRAAALALPTTPSPPRKVTHEYYIRGEGKGEREATLCVPRDVRHELLVRVLPAREGRVVLDQMAEEDRLPLRVTFSNNFEGQVRGPRLPQLGDDLARPR